MDDMKGKSVIVIFREEMHHDGIVVKSMAGVCGGMSSGFFALNNISKATAADGGDVTDKLGIRGKSTFFSTRTVGFVLAGG